MPHEGLDASPVEQSARSRTASELPRQKSTQGPAQADVYAHDAPGALGKRQLDVAGSGQPSAGHIDQPVPENVLAQEHLAAAPLKTAEIELISRELNSARLELGDRLGGDEEIASGDVRLEPCDWGIGAVGQPDDQVFHAAEVLAASIDEPALEKHR